MSMTVKFWGVRGSIPTPLTSNDVAEKIEVFLFRQRAAHKDANLESLIDLLRAEHEAGHVYAYGGNTSCVEVRAGGELIILDMGTGLRPLGNQLMGEVIKNKGIRATFLLSHEHWDHIQGLPFFAPLYLNKYDGFKNDWNFHGGTEWYKRAEECLRGQMDPPSFPVSFREIEQLTHRMAFMTVHDGQSLCPGEKVSIECRKLDHPQETYGYRISHGGKVIAYTTDHEPRHPRVPYKNLLRLIQGADLWITDCQYTNHQYTGENGGLQRFGWGHAYPTAISQAAVAGGVKKVVTFHHDPSSSDDTIRKIAADVFVHANEVGPGQIQGGRQVIPAHEGLEIVLS